MQKAFPLLRVLATTPSSSSLEALASARARLDPVASAWSVAVGAASRPAHYPMSHAAGTRGKADSPPTAESRRVSVTQVFFFPRGVAWRWRGPGRSGRVSVHDDPT